MPPIQARCKSAGDSLSYHCHTCSRALRCASGGTCCWGTSSLTAQGWVWECSSLLCSPNIRERSHSKKSKWDICCTSFSLFQTKGENDNYVLFCGKIKFIATRSANKGGYFFKFLAKYTYHFWSMFKNK